MKMDQKSSLQQLYGGAKAHSYTATHWGIYEVRYCEGKAVTLEGFACDPLPSPIGLSMLAAVKRPLRVQRPAVRRSWLAAARGDTTDTKRGLRGQEEFVEVSWEEALDLVAKELERVRHSYGNSAIFGGSYGWSSAGRFHHAQSQVHRFLKTVGGYVLHTVSYSLGIALMSRHSPTPRPSISIWCSP